MPFFLSLPKGALIGAVATLTTVIGLTILARHLPPNFTPALLWRMIVQGDVEGLYHAWAARTSASNSFLLLSLGTLALFSAGVAAITGAGAHDRGPASGG